MIREQASHHFAQHLALALALALAFAISSLSLFFFLYDELTLLLIIYAMMFRTLSRLSRPWTWSSIGRVRI